MPWRKTALTDLLGLDLPIVQAPMAGGMCTPGLVAAVSEAGGLGGLAFGMTAPDAVAAEIDAVRARTDRPFAANVFSYDRGTATPGQLDRSARLLDPVRSELGLPPAGPGAPASAYDVRDQIRAAVEAGPPVLSFTFGMLPADELAECRRRGIVTIGTATSVAEAEALEAAGVDVVCAQGAEAGGHRGTFLHPFEDGMTGTAALTAAVAARVRVPVLAAGGIMDGRGVAAVLALGAAGAQLGTAFLVCDEAGTPAPYREALLSPAAARTAVTRAFSGRPARGILNRLMELARGAEDGLPPYPVQNDLTKGIRAAAAAAGRAEYMSLWAGQGAPLCRPMPAARLLGTLAAEADAAVARLA